MPTLTELSETFSDNLALYRKDCRGLFMCPLCLRTFSRDRIRTDLSKAHIIPQSLRGREWTLACRKCNNRVGSEVESCEKDRVSFRRALSGDGTETTRVILTPSDGKGGTIGPVQADMGATWRGGVRRPWIRPKLKGSNPSAVERLNEVLSGGAPVEGSSMEVQYRETRSAKRANLTHVHTAYLFMFHQFGYEWALDPCAEPIRKQIMAPDEQIILPLLPVLRDLPISDDELALLLIVQPEGWRHFLIVPPMYRGYVVRQAVWLPLFGRPYEQPPQQNGVQLSVVPVSGHHGLLRHRRSRGQGHRFVLDHFAYDAVLHADEEPRGGHG